MFIILIINYAIIIIGLLLSLIFVFRKINGALIIFALFVSIFLYQILVPMGYIKNGVFLTIENIFFNVLLVLFLLFIQKGENKNV